MAGEWAEPDFGDRHIVLRCEGQEVSIYATKTGLQKLIALCRQLLDDPQRGHLHLEDYEVLTSDSLKGTLAVFPGGRAGSDTSA